MKTTSQNWRTSVSKIKRVCPLTDSSEWIKKTPHQGIHCEFLITDKDPESKGERVWKENCFESRSQNGAMLQILTEMITTITLLCIRDTC